MQYHHQEITDERRAISDFYWTIEDANKSITSIEFGNCIESISVGYNAVIDSQRLSTKY